MNTKKKWSFNIGLSMDENWFWILFWIVLVLGLLVLAGCSTQQQGIKNFSVVERGVYWSWQEDAQ